MLKFKNLYNYALILLLSLMLFSCGGGGKGAGKPQTENGKNTITAVDGGTVTYNNEVKLTIPENSLPEDTEIEISPVKDLPSGDGDGLQSFGQAYKFTPAGTTFDLSNPAVMEVEYDESLLTKKGFSPETLALYYYDEELKEYIAVASYVDITKKKIIALVEHFTIYLPMAKAKLATNNIPYIGNQNPVPNPIYAGAPIYIRSTVRDYDGSLSSVRVYFRKLHPVPGTWESVVMTREVRPNSIDTYGYLIPSNFISETDLGTGNDFEYYVKAIDNYGAVRTSTTRRYDIQRKYKPASLAVSPASQVISAGFERYFTVNAKGVNINPTITTVYNITLLPESYSLLLGKATLTNHKSAGILMHANSATESATPERLTVNACGESVSADITIYPGELKGIEILDTNGNHISGNLLLAKNDTYEFDAVGVDEFGNTVLIIPTWTADAGIGTIDSDGKLTASGTDTGKVYITLGEYTDEQLVRIQTRVESTSPANNEHDIENNAIIQVTFTDPIDSSTVNEDSFKVLRIEGGTEYPITGSYSFIGNSLIFTPSAELGPDKDYRIEITGGVQDSDSFPIVPYTFAFKVKPRAVTGVTLDKTGISLFIGNTELLTATIEPADATDKSVTWTSDKTDVATVSDEGLVTAVSSGIAKITVTSNSQGIKADCLVSVNSIANTLFFSEYVEGMSGSNKALEIFNYNTEAVNLQGVTLEIYMNGNATSPTIIILPAVNLSAQDVYVIVHASANLELLAIADYSTSMLSFNGDDTIVLKRNGVILDCIGQIGFDPGFGWGTGLISTFDHTLRRKKTVTTGDIITNDTFTPSIEWNGYLDGTYSDLGIYNE